MAYPVGKFRVCRCAELPSRMKPRLRLDALSGECRQGILATIVCAITFTLLAGGASAHLWYPRNCCNDQDCFRATSVKRLGDGRLAIEAGHITVIVPKGFLAQPSQDNDSHVCVYRDIRGRYHPRCVFLPGIG